MKTLRHTYVTLDSGTPDDLCSRNLSLGKDLRQAHPVSKLGHRITGWNTINPISEIIYGEPSGVQAWTLDPAESGDADPRR